MIKNVNNVCYIIEEEENITKVDNWMGGDD
jgi:hypothetical protein